MNNRKLTLMMIQENLTSLVLWLDWLRILLNHGRRKAVVRRGEARGSNGI